jgi:hypothetical protein
MLSLLGNRVRLCYGNTRREMLPIGGLKRVDLAEDCLMSKPAPDDLLAVDEALTRLALPSGLSWSSCASSPA